ncbi:MAG: DUF2141 domain-containing protein [Bacteroidetes bacterium]|jgi:uncharacterized protein (DUF2141 family)|nr:DUF2141 domain-containing protein [Bacteroidota bacterium]
MKTLSIISIHLWFTIMAFAQQGSLEISIEKTNSLEGKIYVGIFTEENFLMQPVISSETEMKDNYAVALFENLEYDTYAISAYQDVNGNDKLDMDEYGRPTEPWVISGASSSMMPIWAESKFDFKTEKQTIKLKI